MSDLLTLMVPEPKPMWRAGVPLPGSSRGYVPCEQADLRWLAHDYRDHRKGGRWFCWDARDTVWRCLDPFDAQGINGLPDTPPAVDSFGRLVLA